MIWESCGGERKFYKIKQVVRMPQVSISVEEYEDLRRSRELNASMGLLCAHHPYCCVTHRARAHWCSRCMSRLMFPEYHAPPSCPGTTCAPVIHTNPPCAYPHGTLQQPPPCGAVMVTQCPVQHQPLPVAQCPVRYHSCPDSGPMSSSSAMQG